MGENENNILENLNSMQKAAVLHNQGYLRIIAGAGSGKTRVLTHKIAYLINSNLAKPYQILAVTFTNKATNEMRERVVNLVGKNGEKVFISTFHALCTYILRIEISNIEGYSDKFEILDSGDQKSVLDKIYKKYNITSKNISFDSALEYISSWKNQEITWEEAKTKAKNEDEELIANIYRYYDEELKQAKALDFDDLQIFVKKLFDKNLEIAKKWAKKFSHILVDEFQDTSYIQYEIIKHLTNTNQTLLTIVGDPDQTIYTWRGADANLILNFDKDFDNVETITLNQNYRSTKNILNAANKLIKFNKNRLDKDLFTENEEGDEIEFYHAFSVEAEARWVASKINELKKKKVQLKNIAIFYRSNFYSRAFEEALIAENIGHTIYGGQRFFERKEIKDIIAYLRVINDGSEIGLTRIINVPSRKIGPVALQKLSEYAQKRDKNIFTALVDYFTNLKLHKKDEELPISINLQKEIVSLLNLITWAKKAIQEHPIHVVLPKFIDKIKYFSHFKEPNDKNDANNYINELINSIQNWEKNNPDKTLNDYLDEIALFTDIENLESNSVNSTVSLMTIHSSKGLEFNNVFLVGMSEGIFPNKRVLENEKLIEEERRLAYVAITRARERFFISNARGMYFTLVDNSEPSRFILEAGLKNGELFKFTRIDSSGKLNYQNEQNEKLIAGDIINHISLGTGVVLEIQKDVAFIKFEKDGKVRQLLKKHKSIEKVNK